MRCIVSRQRSNSCLPYYQVIAEVLSTSLKFEFRSLSMHGLLAGRSSPILQEFPMYAHGFISLSSLSRSWLRHEFIVVSVSQMWKFLALEISLFPVVYRIASGGACLENEYGKVQKFWVFRWYRRLGPVKRCQSEGIARFIDGGM